ncbi:dihydroneopterin aldolase [Limnochorda pilosa]|uniref:7,8-dihydroneopterin aldolase n=1 Tax=Limnochorda pilosa TaxID=1555112 RepID=A0A0K2SQR0_LIMPI|nr:dihydroneopterin aldolase [Limnochorda pilosa]BAS29342.1 dihydroneopterin aldolase [Limnochorda pilosa]
MDRILLQGMRFHGYHGVLPEERERGQTFEVDLELELDLTWPRASDRIEETVDYRLLYDMVREIMEGPPVHLLEHLAERILRTVRDRVERTTFRRPVTHVRVRVRKPEAPVGGPLAFAQVELSD